MPSDLPYIRHPAIHGDRVAFVTDDDLWSLDLAGEHGPRAADATDATDATDTADGPTARRLTAGLGEPGTPAWSPCGRWLAYVSRDEQNPEVHVMPAEGGPARRLTWLGTDVRVRGWTTHEGKPQIVFVTTQGQPFFRNYHAFAVSPDGGSPRALGLGQVNHIAWSAAGRVAIGRNTDDPARWKRYRGGTAGTIWVDADGSGTFEKLALPGNLTTPMWIGERLHFIGDGEGTGNLYSCAADGTDIRRHTDHDGTYARQASSDGARIVYVAGGDLWLYDAATDATRRLPVATHAHRTQAARRFVPAAEHLEGFRLHPAGHSLALTLRGQLHTMPLWGGAPRRVLDETVAPRADDAALAASETAVEAPTAAGRLRLGQWLADGHTQVAVSDASGEERLLVVSAQGTRALPHDTGRVVSLVAAPTGSLVAWSNHRNEVWTCDARADTPAALVDRSGHGQSEDLAWSPDAAWLAYTHRVDDKHTGIRLHEIGTGTSTPVTRPEFVDTSPAFDPDGRYLYFISVRTFDPVYDRVQFDLGFPRGAKPYLIALQAGGRAPFEPEPRGPGGPGANKPGAGTAPPTSAGATPLRIDLDGIADRVAAFPVPEGTHARIAGARGGRVVWTQPPITGARGPLFKAPPPGKLERYDLGTGKLEVLLEQADDFTLAVDGQTLLVRTGTALQALRADRPAERQPEPEPPGAPASRQNGRIDLGRIALAVEPRREWRQMLREVWRLQRDNFWSAELSGVDWDSVWTRYEPLLTRIATRAELSDLVWEMQGELGTSHAYETGGDHRKPPALAPGHLACDTRWDDTAGGWVITAIAAGDPWDAAAASPMAAIGVEARVGDVITAVGGVPLTRERPPEALLVGRAGQKVTLTLARPGTTADPREVVVTALADDVPVYYRAWVEKNRTWVHAQSGGRVGYFHLPDMQAWGFSEFHRHFGSECERDALIVDVRYNRGGHVSQLLLEQLSRRRLAFIHSRWNDVSTWPDAAVAGPMVALCNEHAGSDGDIFSHNFKQMNLGPLVGTRTWGGVVGIWPRHKLVDGSETTQPEFAFWFADVGYAVENHGTDPDIVIDNAPQDAAAGRDRQLEVALQTALDLATRTPARRAPAAERPNLARTPLPPRGGWRDRTETTPR